MTHTGTAAPSPLVGASVVVWANLVSVRRPRGTSTPAGGGARGEIHGFSRASRLRLLRLLAECQRAPRWFVTLTYPADYPAIAESKAQLRAWSRRLIRNMSAFELEPCILWRLERQKRGAPHYHCLLWTPPMPGGLPAVWRADRTIADACERFRASRSWTAEDLDGAPACWRAMLTFMSGAWFHAAGRLTEDHLQIGTDVAEVTSRRAVTAYVSKYCAKEDDGAWIDRTTGEILPTGRCWGQAGDEALQARRPLAGYRLGEGSDGENDLAALWDELGVSWGTECERQGWPSYSCFVTDEQARKATEFLSVRLGLPERCAD